MILRTKITKDGALDKFQVATARIIDALYGQLSGNHPVTSIDNGRATCELMNGLTEHLKKIGRLPPDISLIYARKTAPDEQASTNTILTDEMYQNSRARSNFAKHADRDAGSTLSFDTGLDVDHLFFNMTVDYETLHCALMEHGLLDSTNETLYPIKRSLLINHHGYKRTFCPQYDVSIPGVAPGSFLMDIIRIQRNIELHHDEEECFVPAGAAACLISRNLDNFGYSAEKGAQKIKELGIWPVRIEANARMVRNPTSKPEQSCEM